MEVGIDFYREDIFCWHVWPCVPRTLACPMQVSRQRAAITDVALQSLWFRSENFGGKAAVRVFSRKHRRMEESLCRIVA